MKYTDKHRTEDEGALMSKRYNSSRNLVRPEPVYEIISQRNWFKAEPHAPKGWYVDKDSIERGIHSPEFYGYGYFRYRIVRLE